MRIFGWREHLFPRLWDRSSSSECHLGSYRRFDAPEEWRELLCKYTIMKADVVDYVGLALTLERISTATTALRIVPLVNSMRTEPISTL
jgi:hypothetical protein